MEWVGDLAGKIKEKGAKRVLLQLPEGLLWRADEISEALREMGIEADIWAEPTFGACDIIPEVAEKLGYDLLVHVGHIKFIKPIPDRNVLYYPIDIPASPEGMSGWEIIQEESISLLTSVQHLKSLPKFRRHLEKMGKKVLSSGYCLGCWLPETKGEAIVFVGTGNFHALAEYFAGKARKVYVADLEKGEVRQLDFSEFERLRMARIGLAASSENFGIIVSTKHGQMEIEKARALKRELERHGKKADIIVMNFVSRERLEIFKKDMYINTACPRIADDPWVRIINAADMDEVFRNWES